MKKQSWFLPCVWLAVSLGGCSDLWGGSTRPDANNCVRNPGVCASGEVCNSETEACETPAMAPPSDDRSLRPTPPASYILPGGVATPTLDYPRDANFVIATEKPATIYYTVDGSPPQPGMGTTLSADSRLNFTPLLPGVVVRWLADYGPAYSLGSERTFVATKNNPSPPDMGVIPDPAVFELSGGPIVRVSPGQQINGSVRFQAWQSTPTGFCPGCIIQYVVSLEGLGPVGCMNTVTGYGPYPGQSASLDVAFNAPMQPGRYRLYSGLTLQFGCDGTVADGPDIGEIFVQ